MVIGLLVESCCFAGILVGWMATRGISPAAIVKIGNGQTKDGPMSTVTPLDMQLATQTISEGASTPIWSSPTVTSGLTPAPPTAQPALPEFDMPPAGRIVFTCFDGQFDQICLMNADGRDRQQLTFENATSFYPSLSADGSVIIFSSNRDGNFEIYVMDINGENPIRLTNNLGNLYAPEISPKGNRVVFTHESGGTQEIWVMRLDGSNPRPLFQGSGKDIDPTWSPDALKVAFASAVSGNTLLYIADLENGKVYPVIREGMAIGGRLSWSPNGSWLAFYAGPRGNRDIYIVSPEGGALQQMTYGGDNLGPGFSPDSQWITFTSYRDGNNEIYIMNINTLQAYRLTSTPEPDWQPRWGP